MALFGAVEEGLDLCFITQKPVAPAMLSIAVYVSFKDWNSALKRAPIAVQESLIKKLLNIKRR